MKEVLLIYDKNFMPLGAVDEFESIQWINKAQEMGSVEIVAGATPKNILLLQTNNIVRKGATDIGLIKSIDITSSADDGDVISVTGKPYEICLDQRCVLQTALNLKDLILLNLRGIILSVDDRFSEIDTSSVKLGETLGFVIENLASQYDFSFITEYIEGGAFLRYLDPINYSVDQTENDFIVYSDNMENIIEMEYLKNNTDVVNTVIGVTESGLSFSIENGEGLDRYESYYSGREETQEELETAVNAELNPIQEHLSGTVNDNFKSFVYGIDYKIGDIVTVKNHKWGKQVSKKITEVRQIIDNEENSIIPTFGEAGFSIIDILKKVK